ncbi:hypothetical protein TIFTF001_045592 [Ficus carica]|uniref:Uncharacterized protein n=1 Tax=Ficus carica TaxID=3494 RepID=A0AA87YS29_FICCA|nr:hypothetical protein TIFTF001_045592 [Ficus carica]
MRVTILTTHNVSNVEGSTREYAEWGRMLATFMARRGIMLETAPRTPRTRTFNIRAGMRTVNYTQFKPGLKDPRSRKAG